MTRAAETIVEDWFNRRGYFTIRGMKSGRNEADLLAFNPNSNDAVHVEVSASTAPMGWWGDSLDSTPKPEKIQGVVNEADKKFYRPNVKDLRERLRRGTWRCLLAYTMLNDEPEQLEVLERCGVEAVSFAVILSDLAVKNRLEYKTDSDAAHFAAVAEAYRYGRMK